MRHLFLITRVPSKFRELVAFLSLVAVFFVGAWVLLIAPNARAHDALPTAAQPQALANACDQQITDARVPRIPG
ncbi:hypothetical protein PZN02_004144 [Sinorhizobium garamanticum]|uniref:Transmembrane protein n=1 Tax=Sinorhizobium garamanticum TaxID=680247 RepID=A0ABY8DK61_9HYPH|nr:hypothetical protein [Sinorhizobium garamanticum]WEX90592.1 hypothetical protein PZN02_004144 [Sinorhizobium garamanticum]